MELNERQVAEIVKVFRRVHFAKITFDISPDRDYIQYRIEESHRIPLYEEKAPITPWKHTLTM